MRAAAIDAARAAKQEKPRFAGAFLRCATRRRRSAVNRRSTATD